MAHIQICRSYVALYYETIKRETTPWNSFYGLELSTLIARPK